MYNYLSIMYLCLCVTFLVVAILLIATLKLKIPQFYQEYRCVLWTASIVLSLPLSFRSILDFLANNNDSFSSYFLKNDKRILEYNIMFFLLTTYFPVFCQISSLVFGYIRRNKTKSYEEQSRQQ